VKEVTKHVSLGLCVREQDPVFEEVRFFQDAFSTVEGSKWMRLPEKICESKRAERLVRLLCKFGPAAGNGKEAAAGLDEGLQHTQCVGVYEHLFLEPRAKLVPDGSLGGLRETFVHARHERLFKDERAAVRVEWVAPGRLHQRLVNVERYVDDATMGRGCHGHGHRHKFRQLANHQLGHIRDTGGASNSSSSSSRAWHFFLLVARTLCIDIPASAATFLLKARRQGNASIIIRCLPLLFPSLVTLPFIKAFATNGQRSAGSSSSSGSSTS
jgi:hypothetical protein